VERRKRTTKSANKQQAAVETLQAIYGRTHLHDDEFLELVCPMFTPGSVSLLREVYNWTLADMSNVNEMDDQKYMLCKRLAEVRNPFNSLLNAISV
jgi:exportin-5